MVYASGGSLREFAARLVKWRVPVKWYLAMLGLPAALTLISSLWLLFLDFPVDYSPILERLPMFFSSLLMITLIAGLGEEPGWRGFALPNLQQRFSPVKATAVLGGCGGPGTSPSIWWARSSRPSHRATPPSWWGSSSSPCS